MVDIHNQGAKFDRTNGRYIKKLYQEDRGDVKRFIEDHAAQGYSAARLNKYLYSLVSIKKKLGKPFKSATTEDIKRFATRLERSEYKAWTKNDLKIILQKYMRWISQFNSLIRNERGLWMSDKGY